MSSPSRSAVGSAPPSPSVDGSRYAFEGPCCMPPVAPYPLCHYVTGLLCSELHGKPDRTMYPQMGSGATGTSLSSASCSCDSACCLAVLCRALRQFSISHHTYCCCGWAVNCRTMHTVPLPAPLLTVAHLSTHLTRTARPTVLTDKNCPCGVRSKPMLLHHPR